MIERKTVFGEEAIRTESLSARWRYRKAQEANRSAELEFVPDVLVANGAANCGLRITLRISS